MIVQMLEKMLEWASDAEGATAVEYAIVASLIAGVIVTAVMGVGTATNGLFQTLVSLWP